MTGREVLFEFTSLGDVARCAAIDAATGVEIVAVGPAGGSRSALEALALRKLERALRASEEPPQAPPTPRRGRLA